MFPLSIEGDIHAPVSGRLTAETVKEKISDDVRKQGIVPCIEGDFVSFTNEAVFQWSFRRYVTVGKAKFCITYDGEDIHIRYYLGLAKLVLAVTFVTIFLGIAISAAENISFFEKICILIGGWLWFSGSNYILISIRTRRFLKHLLISPAT